MSRWFRFYSDAVRNPKVARLNDQQFRLWVELLTVAAENDGLIPPLTDLKHVLKRRLDHLSRGLNDLIRAELMDPLDGGYEPHNWSKFQYKSDTSTERVKKLREKRNVSETPPETEADTETDTETEADIEPKGSRATQVARQADDEQKGDQDEAGDKLLPKHVVEKWNEIAPTLGKPCVRDLTPERRQNLKARIAQYAIEDFMQVFDNISNSPFLRGDNGKNFCNFDWAMKKANFQKILEGNYNNG